MHTEGAQTCTYGMYDNYTFVYTCMPRALWSVDLDILESMIDSTYSLSRDGIETKM